MNAEHLHLVMLEIQEWFEQTGVVPRLTRLTGHLQHMVSQPQTPEHQQNLSKDLNELRSVLSAGRLDKLPLAWRQIIEECGLDNLMDHELLSAVNNAVSRNEITPSIAHESIKKLTEEITTDQAKIGAMVDSIEYFGIGADYELGDDCEISISFPRTQFDGTLKGLADLMIDMDRLILAIGEVDTGSRQDTQLSSLSSTEPTVLVLTTLGAGLLLAKTVNAFLVVYESLLKIKKLRMEIEAGELSKSTLSSIDKDISKRIGEAVNRQTEELLKTANKKIDSARKAELGNDLSKQLKAMTVWMEAGASFSVRAEEYPADSEEGQTGEGEEHNKLVRAIKSENQQMLLSSAMGDEILLLADDGGSNGDEEDG